MEKEICAVLSRYAHFKGKMDDTLLTLFSSVIHTQWSSYTEQDNRESYEQLANGVKQFILEVHKLEEAQPEKLALALKLGSTYALKMDKRGDANNDPLPKALFGQLMLKRSKYKRELITKYWHLYPSLRSAWVQSVASVLPLNQFIFRIMSAGLSRSLMRILDLADDESSIFVAKEARITLSKIFIQSLKNEKWAEEYSTIEISLSQSVQCRRVLEELKLALKIPNGTMADNYPADRRISTKTAITVLSLVIDGVLSCDDPNFVQQSVKQLEMKKILCDLASHLAWVTNLAWDATQFHEDIIKVLVKGKLHGILSHTDLQSILGYPESLMKKKCLKPAILLAFALLKVNLFPGSEEKLLKAIQWPLSTYVGTSDDEIALLPTAVLKNLQKPSFLLLSINVLMKLPRDMRRPEEELKSAQLLLNKVLGVTTVSAVQCQLQSTALNWLADVLDACHINTPSEKPDLELLQLCTNFTKGSSSVVEAAYKCMTAIIKHSPDTKLLQEIHPCLQRSLSELQWEIRDSGLQTITALALIGKDSEVVANWLENGQWSELVMQCTLDGEAYVRASAVTTLENFVFVPTMQKLADEVFAKALHLVKHDTEAITRRAAIKTMSKIARETCEDGGDQQSLIPPCITDLDWEVQLCVISHCKSMLDAMPVTEQSKQPQLFERLCAQGYLAALLVGLQDCDLSVQYESCKLLYKIKDLCAPVSQSEDHVNGSTDSSGNDETLSDFTKACIKTGTFSQDPVRMHKLLFYTELPDMQTLSNTSIDLYQVNPMSMLQDLLTAMNCDSENPIIDCY